MIFTIVNGKICVTGENDNENLQLLKLNGSKALPLVTAPSAAVVVVKKAYKKRVPNKEQRALIKSQLATLRDQVYAIRPGYSGFITNDMASASKSFQAYCYHVISKTHPFAPVRIHAVKKFGGFEVKVLNK